MADTNENIVLKPAFGYNGEEGDYSLRVWLFGFIAVGLLWRFFRFGLGMPIWGDEAMLGLNIIKRTYLELLAPLDNNQVAPITFLWAERLCYQFLGMSEYSMRLPGFIAGILVMLLFYRWVRLLVNPLAAVTATGILCVAYYVVRYSVELKPYGVDLLATLILLLPATHFLVQRKVSSLIWLIGLLPVSLTLSYPVVFTAGGIAVALILYFSKTLRIGQIFIGVYLLTLAVCFLGTLYFFSLGQYDRTSMVMLAYWKNAFPPAHLWQFIIWFIKIHTGDLFAYPVGGKNGGSLASVILFAIGLTYLWKRWKSPIQAMLLLPFVLTFIAAVLHYYPYGDSARVSQHLAPVIIILMSLGILQLVGGLTGREKTRRIVFRSIFSLLLLVGLMGIIRDFIKPYKTKADAQTRTAILGLFQEAKPGEPILVLQEESSVPPNFEWYLLRNKDRVKWKALPSLEKIPNTQGVWVVNCVDNEALIGRSEQILGRKPDIQRIEKLQIGPREQPPAHLEVLHFSPA